jgi:hypothetical protein
VTHVLLAAYLTQNTTTLLFQGFNIASLLMLIPIGVLAPCGKYLCNSIKLLLGHVNALSAK